MAAAHLIAAQRLYAKRHSGSEPVAGEAFNISDFSQNIVSLCERKLPLSTSVSVALLWYRCSLCIIVAQRLLCGRC